MPAGPSSAPRPSASPCAVSSAAASFECPAKRSALAATRAADETRPADARELERRWEGLVDRARAITPGPAGMVARPVFAPLRVEHEQPSSEVWHRLVGMFAGAVGRGRLDKVVLARRVDLRSPVELDVPNALRRLAATAPESTIYAFRRAGRTFLGATPERLALRRF